MRSTLCIFACMCISFSFLLIGNNTLSHFPPEDNLYIMQAQLTEDESTYLEQQVQMERDK